MEEFESSNAKGSIGAFHTEFTEVFTEITEKSRKISPCPLCALLCGLCVNLFISNASAGDKGLNDARIIHCRCNS